jgi:hypothetical protein
MKKITFTKTTETDIDGDIRSTYYVVAVDGIVVGSVEKQGGWGRYGKQTQWISTENVNVRRDTRTELVNELICSRFNLIPAERYEGGIASTVADFLAA